MLLTKKQWTAFGIPFLLGIVLFRVALALIGPEHAVYRDALHHWHIGALLIILVFLVYKFTKNLNQTVLGFGLGMVVDEVGMELFFKTKDFYAYWHPLSWGTAIVLAIIILYGYANYCQKK